MFVFWIGGHPPRHVHVYREGKPLVKWDLENGKPIQGQATRQILKYIRELRDEETL